MPANPKTLQATEAYRRRVIGTRKALQARAEAIWPTIQQFDDSQWPSRMAAAVEQAQTDAVRATSGYLGAVLTLETGVRTAPLPIDPKRYAGLTENGVKLSEAFRSPFIGVLWKLKDGEDYRAALKYGLVRAIRMVGVEYDWAHRQSMLDAIAEDDRFVGWTRAVAGTCGACAAAAGGSVSGALHFEVHPDCQCVSEPEVSPTAVTKDTRGVPAKEVVGQADAPLRSSIERAAAELDDQVDFDKPDALQYVDDLPNGYRAGYDPNTGNILVKNLPGVNPEDRALDYIHERAHAFDTPFGETKWKQTKAKITATPDLSPEATAARNELLDAIKETRAYAALKDSMKGINSAYTDPALRARQRFYHNYLMSDHELIARTFTQYMGTVRPELRAAWERLVRDTGTIQKGQSIIADEEFAEIEKLLENYLRARGALK